MCVLDPGKASFPVIVIGAHLPAQGCGHLSPPLHPHVPTLQSELYSLTSPGGPHYAPQPVRVAAMQTLDALYPMGRRTRRIVRAIFRQVTAYL